MPTAESAVALAQMMRRSGRCAEALEALRPWLNSPSAAVLEEAALALDGLKRGAEAIGLLERAVSLAPGRASAWINLSAIQAELGRHAAAAESSRRACALSPTFVPAWVNLGSALAHCGNYAAAIDAYSRALELVPGDRDLLVDLASALFACGEVARSLQTLQAVLQRFPAYAEARSLFLLALHHATNNPVGLAREHDAFARSQSAVRIPPPREARTGDIGLRVGFVSADFRRHSVWYFLQSLMRFLPSAGVELHCFHTDRLMDEVTERWRSGVHRFVEAGGMSDDELAAAIGEADLDVLVNLGGHTLGGRPALFLRRLAPVQASFLGYPGPVGSPNIDYWIADDVVAPRDEPASALWGGIARLPGSYFCFQPDAIVPECLVPRDGPVVFGSFNVLAKISAVTVRLWSRVLLAVPESILVIKNDGVQGPAAQRLLREFAECGVSSERISWQPWAASRADHLRRYDEIDIALDPFPYNGATTTCEALWMGVPVISLKGLTPASRMGATILTAAGCPEWIAKDEGGFVDLAVNIAKDVERLRASRGALRRQFEASALCDSERFGQAFLTLLRDLVRRAGTYG